MWPEFSDKPFKESDALNKKKADEREANPVKAKVFTRLFYRHWDEYVEDKRQHLFVCEFKDGQAGEPRDVTPGDYDAYPTSTTFSSSVDYTFSPDGTHLVFTAPPKENEAWSTNYDIWRVSVDGKGKPENLTKDNRAADSGPQFSADGKKLAYRSQKKAGYEADRWELTFIEVNGAGSLQSKPRATPRKFDMSVDGFAWLGHEKSDGLFGCLAEKDGHNPLWIISTEGETFTGQFNIFGAKFDIAAKWKELFVGSWGSISATPKGDVFALTQTRLSHPPEVTVFGGAAKNADVENHSQANSKLRQELDFAKPESVRVKGADDTPMQMWIIKPPGFDPKKKWPVAYLVHGGPQGAWTDGWSYRWCPQLWAAQGYVVALPNPRGSTGFRPEVCR